MARSPGVAVWRRSADLAERTERVTIEVDGAGLEAFAGETVATALGLAGRLHLRDSPRAGTPRGPLCLMGVCQECVVEIDGSRAPACQIFVRAGMRVRTGSGS